MCAEPDWTGTPFLWEPQPTYAADAKAARLQPRGLAHFPAARLVVLVGRARLVPVRAAALILTVLVLGAGFALMSFDAMQGGDWPGWDEGWALFAFPLGIPLAILVGLSVSVRFASQRGIGALGLGATLAVWLWGAGVFAVWYALSP